MPKPLQIYLDAEDLERLEAFARERGWTKSQAVRAAIRALPRMSASDPMLNLAGDIDDLPTDLSRDFDRYLIKTFVAAPRATSSGRRRKSAP